MDLLLATVKEFSYVAIHHPFYSVIGSIFLLVVCLRLYCRLTLGVYEDDQDMTGKTVLITGASDGIGKFTALDLAKRNARVLMACRNPGKANKVAQEIKAVSGNPNVVVVDLDLCSFKSVRSCAQDVLKNEKELHVLINNAGISGIPRQLTEDNCETVMQSNHFGHFLLTLLLLDLLKKSTPSRIINVSSIAHCFASLDLEDLTNKKKRRNGAVYGSSKLMNILFTRELAERLAGTGVTVNALHPGAVRTEIFREKRDILTSFFRLVFFLFGKTGEEGAQTTIRLAVDPSLENTTGKYFSDCKEVSVSSTAENKSLAKKAFQISEQIVNETFKETNTL